MRVAGGVLAAAFAVAVTYELMQLGSQNLPHGVARGALFGLLLFAAAIGYLGGSAVCRRAARDSSHIGLFTGIAGAVAGGALGCAYALAITMQYVSSYSSWPQDRLDQVLLLLAYPVFGALGLCLGALSGLLLGFIFGGALRLSRPDR